MESNRKRAKEQKPTIGKMEADAKRSKVQKQTIGAYVPPAKLKLLQQNLSDKSGEEYQRIAWEALKKSIHGLINKVSANNVGIIVRNLFKENIVRGRGLLCRSLMEAQSASPVFTNVYAALVAVVNSKFPNIGELLAKRCLNRFKQTFKRNDKKNCISAVIFAAHLMNQNVIHEIAILQMLMTLIDNGTNDSIEVGIELIKQSGFKLKETSGKGLSAIFDMLRNNLHDGKLEKRVQYSVETLLQIRKDNFKGFESLNEQLDLVEENDQYTHMLSLEDAFDSEDILNVFKLDPEYEQNEARYKILMREILGDDESDGDDEEGSDSDEEGSSGGSGEEGEKKEKEKDGVIVDATESNLVAFRRTVYLTINSSLDYEECAHKLLKMQVKPGQEMELCNMFLDCCVQQRTYEKFYGLLAQKFCRLNRAYAQLMSELFERSYGTVHRLDNNRLRNVARFFAHLLFTDSIPWTVLSIIRLNEHDTTSSGRVFIKILFQELAEFMGISSLRQRVTDPTLEMSLEGLFPKDNPSHTRFSINFFTYIGLAALTHDLRDFLKSASKKTAAAAAAALRRQEESDESDVGSLDSSNSD